MLKYGSDGSKDSPRTSDQQKHPKNVGDENPVRGNWTNRTEYMLSMIGYAVGLGNIWRFPFLAYKNGGGAFLIPYLLMLFLCGILLFFLESAVGQFCSQGPINMWRAVPILQGAGFSVVMTCLLLSIYYNVLIAYSVYFMFASMQSPLPWSDCFSWADSNCSTTPEVYCNVTGVLVANWTQTNMTCSPSNKITVPMQSPSEQYWDRVVLQRSSGLDETGPVVWHLALCLLLSSTLVAAALIKGIKSSGKVFKQNHDFNNQSAKKGVLIWSLIKSVPPSYGNIPYPGWGLALGWCMVACVLIWIPLVAGYKMSKAEGRFWKRLMSLCSPSEKWRPYLVIHRGERYSEQTSQ